MNEPQSRACNNTFCVKGGYCHVCLDGHMGCFARPPDQIQCCGCKDNRCWECDLALDCTSEYGVCVHKHTGLSAFYIVLLVCLATLVFAFIIALVRACIHATSPVHVEGYYGPSFYEPWYHPYHWWPWYAYKIPLYQSGYEGKYDGTSKSGMKFGVQPGVQIV